jgi:hypothetical protein
MYFPKVGGTRDDDIENSFTQYADQLCLRRRRRLEMKTAQRAPSARARLIVLDEATGDGQIAQTLLMKSLAEPAPIVGMAPG